MTIRSRVSLSAFVLAGATVLLATGWYVRAANFNQSEASSNRWEYLVVAGGTASLDSPGYGAGRKQKVFAAEASAVERNLDVLGEDGWELVSVGGTPNQPAFFLKRPARKR